MLQKILNRRLINQRNILYFFSKDPFDKFNRKKQARRDDDPKAKSPEKGRPTKHEKTAAPEPESYNKNIDEMKQNDRKQKQEQLHHTGFQKFGHKSFRNFKPAEEPNQQNQQSPKNEEPKVNNQRNQQQEKPHEQEGKKEEAQSFANENNSNASKGFEKFNRKRSPPPPPQKQKRKSPAKKQAPQRAETPKEEPKPSQAKKIDIPTINLDLDPNDIDQTTVLRKAKGHKNKKPIQESQPVEPEASISAKQQQQLQQNKKWEEFELQKEKIKASHKQDLPRYERLNLLKDQEESEKKKQENSEQPVNHKKNFTKLVIAGVGLMLLSNNEYFKWNSGKEVDPQYLKQAIQEDRIDETWVQYTESDLHNEQSVKGKNFESFIYIREKNGDISYCVSNQQFENLWLSLVDKHNQFLEKKAPDAFPVAGPAGQISAVKKITLKPKQEDKNSSLVGDARSILSMVLLYFFIKSIMDVSKGAKSKGGKGASGLFENQKSHRFREVIKVTFQDVVGMQKAKDEIVEFIDFLKHPQKYNRLGARIPKGALLTGPPGTGKTMIAKACAGESKVPFFTISGSEFIEMYVGVGAQRVRNLFKQAKENAPSIIFIDEIDAVGKKRSGMGGGGNDERDTTLNQLLVEMDGFDTNTNVIVFAATNQKEVLDAALTRPGRFDRMIEIDLPDLEGRREIFEVHLKPLVLEGHVEIKDYAKRLATLTPGFSGADIKNVCNEAAIIAARNNKEHVSIIDFELATERIIGGVEKRSQLITPETRKTVAYHECGHGVVSWFIENANPLLKLTIIPRSKGALGFAQYLPNEHQMYTKLKLLDEICVILGGRVAEEIFFGKISTGASDDLNKAYQIAKAYVTQYGFGDKLGWIQYGETEYAKEYSKEIENNIDAQILQIMRVCSERTRNLVREKKELIHKLAEKLLELETIDQNIIAGILGERPFKMSKQHEEYIKEKKRISEEILGSKPEENTEAVTRIKRSDYVL